MADDRTIRVRFLAEVGSYMAAMSAAGKATGEFAKNVSGHGQATSKHLKSVSTAALAMSAGIGLALGASVKAAIDWESAWAGVTKTVSGSKSEMADLEQGLRGLATSLPASHKEIAAVAEAAGQLGIQRSAIVGFTETMVALGVSTNLTADQAATGIAQIANVMGTSQTDIDRFGATLVALGNVGASTESEILEMAKRLSGAGKLVGASESDVLGLANAMASMGIEAQLGGGSFSRVMLKIYSAVKGGGDRLKDFAKVANLSADEFSSSFEKDPIRAIDSFIQGLNRIDASGGNVVAALADLGIKGTQDLQVLLRLKGAGDLLSDSLTLGSKAWLENVALTNEANKRYETTASRLKVLRNQVVDVGIDMGGVMLPAVKSATTALSTMVTGFAAMDGTSKTVVQSIAGITGAGLGLIGILGTVGPKIKSFTDGLSGMGTIGGFVGANLGMITGGLAVAGAALALYTYIVGQNAKEQAEAAARAESYTDAIIKQGDSIGEATNKMALEDIVKGNIGKLLRDTASDMQIFVAALNQGGPAADQMDNGLQDLADGLRSFVMKGESDKFQNFFDLLDEGRLKSVPGLEAELRRLASSGQFDSGDLAELIDRIREANQARGEGAVQARNQAAAEEAATAATDGSTSAERQAKKALDDRAASAKEVSAAIKEMTDANHAALDPLFGLLDSAKANKDAQKALSDAQKEGGHSADDLAEMQRKVATSALDMDGAALQLAGSIAAGKTNLDIANQTLQGWVDQGLITKDTAAGMAAQFQDAATKADKLAGDRVGSITVSVSAPGLSELEARVARLQRLHLGTPDDAGSTSKVNAPLYGPGQASGGLAGTGTWALGPRGSDVIPTYLAHGEYVVSAAAVQAYGVDNLDRINSMSGGSVSPSSRFGAASSTPRATSAGGSQVSYFTTETNVYLDGSKFLPTIRKTVRKEGGNVQQVLGAG